MSEKLLEKKAIKIEKKKTTTKKQHNHKKKRKKRKKKKNYSLTPFTQLLQTRVCFTNAGINTYGAEIHKVKKTCNSRISIVPISNITFQTLCK